MLRVLGRKTSINVQKVMWLIEEMNVDDPSHAFYLGFEMAKALTALTLHKDYRQDQALKWGFLTREEVSHRDKKRKSKE